MTSEHLLLLFYSFASSNNYYRILKDCNLDHKSGKLMGFKMINYSKDMIFFISGKLNECSARVRKIHPIHPKQSIEQNGF